MSEIFITIIILCELNILAYIGISNRDYVILICINTFKFKHKYIKSTALNRPLPDIGISLEGRLRSFISYWQEGLVYDLLLVFLIFTILPQSLFTIPMGP